MSLRVFCIQCELAMYLKHSVTSWEGDWETTVETFECRDTACQTTAVVTWKTFIPVDVARMRQEPTPPT